MEQARKAFEAWARDHHWRMDAFPGGTYVSKDTEAGWQGWRARDDEVARLREALTGLVAALRPMEAYFISPSTNREISAYFKTLDAARAALEPKP